MQLGKTNISLIYLVVALIPLMVMPLFPNREIHTIVLILVLLSGYLVHLFQLNKIVFGLCLLFLPLSLELPIGGGSQLAFPIEPLLVILGISLLFKGILSHSLKIPGNLLTYGVTLLLISYWTTTIFSSMPAVSLKFSLINSLFILTGMPLGFSLGKDFRLSKMLELMAIPFAVICLYAIFNFIPYGFSPGAAMIVARPFFKDHTLLAAVLALVLPLYVLYPQIKPCTKPGSRKAYWPYVLSGIIFFVLVVSSSRAAWLSIVAIFLLFIFIKLKGNFQSLIFILGASLILAMYFQKEIEERFFVSRHNSGEVNQDLGDQFRSVTNLNTDVSNLERINRWKCAIRMFNNKPLKGYGPGTYQFQYIPWQHTNEMTYISVSSPFVTENGRGGSAHSEYLLLLSENGILGLVSFLIIVFSSVYILFKRINTAINKRQQITTIAILLSLSTYFVHSLFNNFLNVASLSLLFWTLIGFTLSYSSKQIHYQNPGHQISI